MIPWGSDAVSGYWLNADANVKKVDGYYTGLTTQIFQWAGCKWGIDENVAARGRRAGIRLAPRITRVILPTVVTTPSASVKYGIRPMRPAPSVITPGVA